MDKKPQLQDTPPAPLWHIEPQPGQVIDNPAPQNVDAQVME